MRRRVSSSAGVVQERMLRRKGRPRAVRWFARSLNSASSIMMLVKVQSRETIKV